VSGLTLSHIYRSLFQETVRVSYILKTKVFSPISNSFFDFRHKIVTLSSIVSVRKVKLKETIGLASSHRIIEYPMIHLYKNGISFSGSKELR
jgi:hypothetical protein